MSQLPSSFALQGSPVRLANVGSGLGLSLRHTPSVLRSGYCYVLLGMDVSATATTETVEAWYTINALGRHTWYRQNQSLTDPFTAFVAQWRGQLPFSEGDVLEMGIESFPLPSVFTISAWGLEMPIMFAGER